MKQSEYNQEAHHEANQSLYAEETQSVNHFGVSLLNDVTAYLNE